MVKTLLLPGGGGGKRGGAGSIPGWVTKIPHAGQHSQKEKEREKEPVSFSLWMRKSREVKEFSELVAEPNPQL